MIASVIALRSTSVIPQGTAITTRDRRTALEALFIKYFNMDNTMR